MLNNPSAERVDRTVQALTPAFRGDPVYTWLLHTFDSSDHDSVRRELLRAFFTQCALNDGLFIEVDDYGSCGLLIPPGAAAENPWTLLQAGIVPALWNIGLGTFKRAFLEYAPSTERMMEEAFTEEERKNHWYVFIMGTSADRRRQGLSSALVQNMQEKARTDGRPIWLEATTEASQNLYLKHGFQNHGEIILFGKGKVGRDGLLKKAGEGILIWSMSWRP
ncbi:hypothetical protein N8I77_000118 [Diaporthe amygdali]|uniref:N-acetyltransferase domain-containing protein n=1 Tax=Phomopsis amygdali TaxID=1214568 RepID=A0AAD9SMQ4_PHOAM|nr:hypothetical protein N8I77_000118 [Diaporthe amygdali]